MLIVDDGKVSDFEKGVDVTKISNLDWIELSYNIPISESFIEKYSDKLDFDGVISRQRLSESFIEKCKRLYI